MRPSDQNALPAKRSYLWVWIAAVIAVQLVAWTAWLAIAAHHPVATVPLVTPKTR